MDAAGSSVFFSNFYQSKLYDNTERVVFILIFILIHLKFVCNWIM